MRLFTWGYQGRSLTDLIILCRRQCIDAVVDVRRFATSSQPGWNAFSLNEDLGDAGLAYSHLSGLGNYSKGLPWTRTDPLVVGASVRQVVSLLKKGEVLLLCRERPPKECHRLDVAAEVGRHCSCEVVHLGVSSEEVEPCSQISMFAPQG